MAMLQQGKQVTEEFAALMDQLVASGMPDFNMLDSFLVTIGQGVNTSSPANRSQQTSATENATKEAAAFASAEAEAAQTAKNAAAAKASAEAQVAQAAADAAAITAHNAAKAAAESALHTNEHIMHNSIARYSFSGFE